MKFFIAAATMLMVMTFSVCASQSSYKTDRHFDKLDRGLTVMSIGGGEVYVGWRMLKADPKDVAFNVYRNSVKLNDEPITTSTNWLDKGADLSKANTYLVRPVVNGELKTGEGKVTLAANSPLVRNLRNKIDMPVHLSFPFLSL